MPEFNDKTNPPNDPFSCGHCESKFESKTTLKDHIIGAHSKTKPEKSFQCAQCPRYFSKNYRLKNHILTDHEGKRLHECDSCEKAFKTKTELSIHTKRLH